MKKRWISLLLAMLMTVSCFAVPVYAGKGDNGPFDYIETGVYRRVESEWGGYNERLNTLSVTLPASETGIGFSYLAILDGEEYGNGSEMTPLPSGWTVDYLFTYCTVDLDAAGIPLTLAMAIPIGMDAAAWAAAVNQYVDETYESWSAEHPDESKWDYSIVCDYTPFLKAREESLAFSASGALPLKTDAELYSGGGSVYSDRYYACIARFRQAGETVSFSSVYNAETLVDFNGPGSQDYTPSVLSEPAPLGDHEKSGSGELTEKLNATAVYGNKEMSYCWFRSDTGAEGTYTTIYGADGAFYQAPYPAEAYASAYYYATYRYTDDNNIPREGRTTVAKLTRTAYTNFTLQLVPDFIESSSPTKPDDFVLPQSLESCTVTFSSAANEFSDTFTVQNFTCEKQYNIPISSDYVVTVTNTVGNTIYHTQRVPFSSPGTVFTIGLDAISLMDLQVFLDGNIASLCPSLDPAGLHVSAWYCDYRYTPEGESFASGVVDSDGYVDWTGYGRELPAKGYVLCQITDEVLETEDAKMYLNTDRYYHVQPYQLYVPDRLYMGHCGDRLAIRLCPRLAGRNASVLPRAESEHRSYTEGWLRSTRCQRLFR